MSTSNINTLKVFFIITAFLSIYFANSYALTNSNCNSAVKQQSPININSTNALFREELNFRIINVNYSAFNGTWSDFPQDQAIGFKGEFGYLHFVKDWSIYKFDLKEINFRYLSGHKIDNKGYDIEMELIHDIDSTFRTKGRYIKSSADKFIVSVFFTGSEWVSEEEKLSLFFNYTNIEQYAENTRNNTVSFTRDIKLNLLVKNMPSYFYEGTTTSIRTAGCETAWRMILPKFQSIPMTHVDAFKTILSKLNYINTNQPNSSNTRNIQVINSDTRVYMSDPDKDRVLIETHAQQYDKERKFFIDYLTLVCLSIFLVFFS